MDKVELSNLAFLIRALIANPSQKTFAIAESNMLFGGSSSFRAAIAILEDLIKKLEDQEVPRRELVEKLSDEAKKLTKNPRALEKSVGQALIWAMESTQSSSSPQR